jgi:hypothetical protein
MDRTCAPKKSDVMWAQFYVVKKLNFINKKTKKYGLHWMWNEAVLA